MGTFVGHLVPGLALAFLGIWHTVNTIYFYYLGGSTKFLYKFWYPFTTPLQHLELILISSFSIFAIVIQVFDFQHLKFSFELDSMEHATIFLQLLIFSFFTLYTELNHLSESVLGVSGILVSSIFGQELFLLHYHSTDHVGLEGHYHWLMQLIVCLSFVAAVSAMSFPASLHSAIILSVSVIFQGCWFINMGFMLWVQKFIPRGCVMQKYKSHSSTGAVTCVNLEDDLRARAFANMQFCWILSGIMILVACVGVIFGRRSMLRRQSLEYEQLSGRVAHDPLANVGFKQIQL